MRVHRSIGLLVLALLAAGCDSRAVEQRLLAWKQNNDPTQLWSIEVTDAGVTSSVRICANAMVREALMYPVPEANGQSCVREIRQSEYPGAPVRCHIGAQSLAVSSRITGDSRRDFVQTLSILLLVPDGPTLRQVRHFRLLGSCPAGWSVGDRTDRQGRLHRVPTT